MSTRKLFTEDVYQREATAKVVSVKPGDKGLAVTLDQTVFFPTGGGQSCDRGVLGDFQVVDVYEEEGEILHIVNAPESALKPGDETALAIDWDHRFDNMQRHCGEHILSGIFYELYGGVNRGFHMGDEYMTIDISLEENPEFTEVTWEMAEAAELAANQVVWQNLPVITRHFDTREEAETLPMRKALALEEDITIVCVGSPENPADCVACCGTHPSTAGQVGLIKIHKVETNKGMFRIYFEAGQRAFKQYQTRFNVLTSIEGKFSAGTGDLLSKYEAQQEKNKAARDQLYHLKKQVLAREIADISAEITPAYVRKYDILSIDDILQIGRELAGKIPTVLFLVHQPSNTVLLFSDDHDCGKLVKENADIYNGKGGGNKNSARAIFPKAEYIDTYIDLIEKHLR